MAGVRGRYRAWLRRLAMETRVNAQLIAVVVIVASALFFVARRVWRAITAARKPKSGCGSDCDCH